MAIQSWDEVDELYREQFSLSEAAGQGVEVSHHWICEQILKSGADEFAEHLLTSLGLAGVLKLTGDLTILNAKEYTKLKEGDAFAKEAGTEYQAAMAAFDCVKKARENVEELERECGRDLTPLEQILRNASPEDLEAIRDATKLYMESEEGKAEEARAMDQVHKILESFKNQPLPGQHSALTIQKVIYAAAASEDQKLSPEQLAKVLPLMTSALNKSSAFARSFEKLGNKLKALRHTNNAR